MINARVLCKAQNFRPIAFRPILYHSPALFHRGETPLQPATARKGTNKTREQKEGGGQSVPPPLQLKSCIISIAADPI